MRVSEIKDFTKQQLQQFIKQKRLQVYQSKQNKYTDILLYDHALTDLMALKEEMLSKRQTYRHCETGF